MSDQYIMTEEATFDADTGEIVQPALSREAARGIRRPNLWQKKDGATAGVMAGDEFSYAFLCLQEEIRPVIEADKDNPFAKKGDAKSVGYTSLGGLLKVIRPVLNKWFFTIEQYAGDVIGLTDTPGNKHLFLPVFTRLEHVPSMQHKTYKVQMPIVGFTCQAIGSALTYGKRYSLMGALGISTGLDDDDGNAASIVKGIDGALGEFAQGLAEKMKSFKDARGLTQWAKDNASGFDILEESDRQKLRVLFEDLIKEFSADQTPPAKGKK